MEDPAQRALPLPRSFFRWLPFLWTQVLFPGPATGTRERVSWKALAILLLVPGALLYPSLGFHLFEPDESRYAQIPREMLLRGELVVPYLQGEPYLDKPPMLYWGIMASYAVFGVHDWSARLVPALAIHGAILLVYLLGRRLVGNRSAFWGALLLSLTPGFMGIGRLLLLDGLLAFWTTLALFAGFEAVGKDRLRWGWWMLCATACGLGILTKGPIALVLLAPPLWLHRRLTGQTCRIGLPAFAAFFGVLLLINLPWYIAIYFRIPEFVRYFFWEHHVLRYMTSFAHEKGFWFYVPIVLLGMLPGTFLLWWFVRFLLAGDEETAKRRSPQLGFLLLSGGWCILFFTLSACKLPTYVMPAFPFLALALGYFIVHAGWRVTRWPLRLSVAAFLFMAFVHHLAIPWYAWYRSPMGNPELVASYLRDLSTPVVCYPRPCNSVAFYLNRDDMVNYRSKEIEDLRAVVRSQPRTVILCTHRHSLEGLRQLLPPEVHVVDSVRIGLADIPGIPARWMRPLARLLGETAMGLCDIAVVERR